MNYLTDIEPGSDIPNVLNVIVEVPKESRNKYEYDKKNQIIKLDRLLYSPVAYPGNYGFVPQTLWDDGDPLDVLILTRYPVYPGILVEAKPIGAIEMIDKGEDDLKIIAIRKNSLEFPHVKDISELSPHVIAEVRHFFQVYKELQNVKVDINKTLGAEEAKKSILKSIELYKQKQ